MKSTWFRVHWSLPDTGPMVTDVEAMSPAAASQKVREGAMRRWGTYPMISKVKVDRR